MNEILQFKTTSIVIFSILLLIEAAQFLWYTVHPDLSFLWQTNLADYLRVILHPFHAIPVIYFRGLTAIEIVFIVNQTIKLDENRVLCEKKGFG